MRLSIENRSSKLFCYVISSKILYQAELNWPVTIATPWHAVGGCCSNRLREVTGMGGSRWQPTRVEQK
ncbi:hypothetical protein RRG08_043388 [Elysia crispata]|uniref:Uncharacterized protein n=1 Tax=Elysia crispata TaxID=231223 RepID=A0AAE1E4Z0_9GAST|nr:hypothetical protein RRG08_043388 [Elysia crispata]